MRGQRAPGPVLVLALAVAASAGLAGAEPATGGTAPASRQFRDDTGELMTLPARPARIACLSPDLTEIAWQVGAGPAVVGACDQCDFPPEARGLPRVGPMVDPSVEAIVLLRPDLVLATGEGNPLATVTRLRSLGVPVAGLRPRGGIAGVARQIRLVGDLTGHAVTAERLAASMEDAVDAVRRRAASRPRVNACVLVWTDPLVAAGSDAYLTELADAAGAGNACALARGWPTLSREQVLLANPEVVLLGIAREDAVLGDWAASLPAVRAAAVLRLPEHPFLRPSATLGRAAEDLERMLAGIRGGGERPR